MKSFRTIGAVLLFLAVCIVSDRAAAESVTVAALKIIPTQGDNKGNFAKLEDYARRAAAGQARIIVTPECYLDGYLGGNPKNNPGMTREKVWQAAETVDGPYNQRAATLARELKVYLLFGFSERRGDQTYNTAALYGPDGKRIGQYSKSHTHAELYEPGNEFPVFTTPIGKMGILICADRQLPETARILAVKGAEIILIPGMSPHVGIMNEDVMMRVRAYENQLYVVWDNPYNALIAAPNGDIIAHNGVRDEEGIVYAQVDLKPSEKARLAMRNRRPDLYGALSAENP